jgi:hypothetical protein
MLIFAKILAFVCVICEKQYRFKKLVESKEMVQPVFYVSNEYYLTTTSFFVSLKPSPFNSTKYNPGARL